MSWNVNRRELLLAGGAAWLGAGALGTSWAHPRKVPRKFCSSPRSSGFPHIA